MSGGCRGGAGAVRRRRLFPSLELERLLLPRTGSSVPSPRIQIPRTPRIRCLPTVLAGTLRGGGWDQSIKPLIPRRTAPAPGPTLLSGELSCTRDGREVGSHGVGERQARGRGGL